MNKEYLKRINRTIDFMEKNIAKEIFLEDLARVSHFSKFHFNRVFHGVIGEPPRQFLLRIRLEKAANLLLSSKRESVSEVAAKCGFSDPSVFSRSFKKYFGISASKWREQESKKCQEDSNSYKDKGDISVYFCHENKQLKWKSNMETNKGVKIEQFATMNVAYVRHIGPYKGNENLFKGLWSRLFSWSAAKGLLSQPDFKSLVVYHDDPNISCEDRLRISVCVTIPKDFDVDGEIGKMEVDGGRYAVGRFEIDATQFEEAWGWMFSSWLPQSGFQPDDRPCFELYPQEPVNGKFIVDICIPVKSL